MRGSTEAWGASLWQRCFAGFRTASLHVRRAKQGTPSTHPIVGDELRALRRLQRDQEPKSPFVFTSERGTPFTTAGFARMIDRAATRAKLAIKPHPHMRAGTRCKQGPRHKGAASIPGS